MALPAMKVLLSGATAHTSEPKTNRPITNMKTYLTTKIWNILPQVGPNAVEVSRYAAAYQFVSDKEWNSSVTRGLAVSGGLYSRVTWRL